MSHCLFTLPNSRKFLLLQTCKNVQLFSRTPQLSHFHLKNLFKKGIHRKVNGLISCQCFISHRIRSSSVISPVRAIYCCFYPFNPTQYIFLAHFRCAIVVHLKLTVPTNATQSFPLIKKVIKQKLYYSIVVWRFPTRTNF